jgi:MoaA/NifB/PqqE/SkfB family radical SAM enzyme
VDWLFQTPTSREAYENTVKVVHEILDGVEHVESTPPSVTFTVEQNCNIRCVMCSVVFGGPEIEGTPRVLSAAGAEELIPLFPKIRSLALMGGEPTLAPVTRELLARYDAERYPDATAFMTTNGLLLTPKYTAAFRKTRLNVMISINAATPETYEHITGRRGGFERVVENIRALLDPQTGPEHRPVIMLSFVVMKDTYREVPDFLRLAQELGTTVRLQAVYGELGGQSIFTDEALLTTVSEFFDREVLPVLPVYPKNYQVSAERLAHIMKSRLERRDFTPY